MFETLQIFKKIIIRKINIEIKNFMMVEYT